jgi:hypothetical protein
MNEKMCQYCLYYDYDIEANDYYCTINIDQDDLEKMMMSPRLECCAFRMGDDYSIVKKQGR